MTNHLILMLYFLMWHLLVVLALLFALSGLDDLFIDICFWCRYVWRMWKMRRYKPLTYEQLLSVPEQPIAILVPCWQEANVIATMLTHNCNAIDYNQYVFFVGVYPNDPATITQVQAIAATNCHVHCVIGPKPGPSNKAANLNTIYAYVKNYEKTLPAPFQIFVFHDSEDVIHPLSFRLYNYLIPRKDMIQIPVFPLEVSQWNFTHWLYADEFAESHTKDIIVREAIGAHVPSAGVGTAFSRHALQILEDNETALPFSTDSLTEDYRTSLMLHLRHLTSIFVTQSVLRTRWYKKGIFKPRYVQKCVNEYVATRALFPQSYRKAVRQKARWIIGIVFQEWDHTMWPKNWIVRFTLLHDRKGFITHFINGFSYIVLVYWLIYSWCIRTHPEYPSLQEQLNAHHWVWGLIVFVSIIMLERLIQRMIAIRRIYGWKPLWLAPLRVLYGNWLNLHALLRAYHVYFSANKSQKDNPKAQPAWDKTEHEFPGRHLLVPFRRKLGDLLLEQKLLTVEQLQQAVLIQQQTGQRLGEVLLIQQLITPQQLTQILAQQYKLELITTKDMMRAEANCASNLPKRTYKWLTKHKISPISFDHAGKVITLALHDPTNELLLTKIMQFFKGYEVSFKLAINC